MKKLLLLICASSIFMLFSCKQLAVDKDGKNIYEKLIVAFDQYDKPMIDSILNTNIDLQNKYYAWHVNNLLGLSVAHNDILRFSKLLDKGAKIMSQNNHFNVVDNILASSKNEFFDTWMRSTKTIINKTEELDMPLIWAVRRENLYAAKQLIKKGANVNFYYHIENTNLISSPIQAAIDMHSLTMVEFLIEQKLDLKQTFILWKGTNYEQKDATILHYLMTSSAAHNYDNHYTEDMVNITDVLLKNGLNVNSLTNNGLKAIDVINFNHDHFLSANQPMLVEFLISHGSVLKSTGYSTIENALKSENFGIIGTLILKGIIQSNEIELRDEMFSQPRYVKALSGIKIRERPSTQSNVLAGAAYQERVFVAFSTPISDIIEGISGHWVCIKFNNKKGFVFSGFLSE